MTYQRKNKIKELLYSYAANRRRVVEIERSIISATPERGEGGKSGPGDPTSARAIRLMMDEELDDLRQKIAVVDRFIEHVAGLPAEKRQVDIDLVRYVYTDRLSLGQAAARMGVTERWLRDRNKAMLKILEGIAIALRTYE